MQELVVGLLVLLAVAFMVRHIRRATAGRGGCGCGSSGGDAPDDGRRVNVPGLSCPGSCARCRACAPGK